MREPPELHGICHLLPKFLGRTMPEPKPQCADERSEGLLRNPEMLSPLLAHTANGAPGTLCSEDVRDTPILSAYALSERIPGIP